MNKMKLLFIILFSALSRGIVAQTFSVSVPDTIKTDTLNSEIIFYVNITNITNAPLSVYMVRRSNELPANWQSSLCLDLCFAPFVDSIATTSAFGSSALAAGEKRTISLHVFPFVNQGTASVKMVIGSIANPLENKTYNFTAHANVTSINNIAAPDGYHLAQNYPNPFNPSTVINYSIARGGQVTLKLYNIAGQEIASFINEHKEAGSYNYEFNSKSFPSGVYFYKIQSGDFMSVKKMILIK
jgi:hypothetical protein